ncbi:MAG: FeoA family protein [Syntrophobacterales bacterium]
MLASGLRQNEMDISNLALVALKRERERQFHEENSIGQRGDKKPRFTSAGSQGAQFDPRLFVGFRDVSMIPLSDFRQGDRGVIIRLKGSGSFRKRLQEMGFIKGAEVFVEKYAPLRDPIELVLKGYHISLRVEEASQVMMEKLERKSA